SVKLVFSRRDNRPAIWSISAPVNTTASIGLPRKPFVGCKAGVARIWAARSGDALIRVQRPSPAETAMPAWVRGRTRLSPAHASAQTGQRQFHYGNAPPAAEPSTITVRRPI